MSVIEMQSVIARLCVDTSFRRAFIQEPEKILATFDLTGDEAQSLKALDMESVQDYASSLVGKKMALLQNWLPLSLSYLEQTSSREKVRHILRDYSLDTIRDTEELGGTWVQGEYERLRNYLRQLSADGEIDDPYFADLLEFETTVFLMGIDQQVSKAASTFADANKEAEVNFTEEFQTSFKPVLGQHVCVRGFNYDVGELITCLEAKQPLPELQREETWVLFFKIPHSVKAETHTINLPLKDLLEMCGGALSIKQIITTIAAKYAGPDGTAAELADDCLQILEQLYAYGAVIFAPVGRA